MKKPGGFLSHFHPGAERERGATGPGRVPRGGPWCIPVALLVRGLVLGGL